MSLETCQIGGNIAENAGGGKAVKYGVTGHYVRGLEIVTSWGEVLHFGGKTQKDVTGYDILHLLVGSEGTLAIVTKIYLRVLPRSRERAVLLCPFSSIEAALKTPWLIMGKLGIVPTALELMSHQSLEFAYQYCESAYPFQEAPCHLLVEIDGQREEEVFNSYLLIGEKLLAEGAKEVFVADESSSAEEIWKIRRAIPEAIHQTLSLEINEDVSLPLTALHSFINFIEQLSRENDLLCPFYGHLGDGNLHVTLAPRKSEEWEILEPRLRKKFYQEVKKLGGVLTGEHGVGLKRRKYLPIFLGPSELRLLQTIKQVFDPKGILNPGKIFPEHLA
ncbi:MAG: FAD-binding protein, partial [Candidatus Atribacteria bacterium]|nr:FAD-binding protein [Candidatus Atribacteria bacterium]MCD6349277.1 FAD-binding protein [Candidatus Atribacteria bacterium]